MSTTQIDHAAPIAPIAPAAHHDFGWAALLRWGAITGVLASIATMTLNRFVGPSMVVLIVVLSIGLWLLRRHQRAGAATIGVVSALDLAFHGPLSLFLLPVVDYPRAGSRARSVWSHRWSTSPRRSRRCDPAGRRHPPRHA